MKRISINYCNFLLVLSITFFGSCIDSKENIPDTSSINIRLETKRFDLDLYAIDTNNVADGLKKLRSKYPNFLDYFLDTLMAYGIHGNYNDTVTGIREGVKPFLAFKDYKELEEYIQKKYPDTKNIDQELTKGFKLVKHYFPSYSTPRIIYLNMGLSGWSSFPVDSFTHCIGLDMFLEIDFPHYQAVGVHSYMKAHFRESYIPVAVFSSIYRAGTPLQTMERPLIDLMVQRGKEQYFLHRILPELPDSVLFGFTQKQIEWCNANEAFTYNFFIKNQLLFSKEAQNIMPFVTDGPFAQGMEAANAAEKFTPGNIGTWLGYKMISAYMMQNPNTSLEQLINLQINPATFLSEAKYKPR